MAIPFEDIHPDHRIILGWVKVRKSLSPWPLLVGGLMYGVFIAYVLGVLRR